MAMQSEATGRCKVLFMQDSTGEIVDPRPPYSDTFYDPYPVSRPFWSFPHAALFEAPNGFRAGEKIHYKGMWLTQQASDQLRLYSPAGKRISIALASTYRVLVAARDAELAWVPPGEISCLFFNDVFLALNGPDGEDAEDDYHRALVNLSNQLTGIPILNRDYGKLALQQAGLAKIEQLKKSKLPNLDHAIRSCVEFSIPVDLQELETELKKGTLPESELVRMLLG